MTYTANDVEDLIRLLGDTTRRLHDLLNARDRLMEEKVAVYVQVAILGVIIMLGLFVFGNVNELFEVSVVIAVSSIWFHSAVLSVKFFFTGLPRLRFIRREIKSLTPKLERIVRASSEIAEHMMLELGERMRLEFQLDLSEEALRRAVL